MTTRRPVSYPFLSLLAAMLLAATASCQRLGESAAAGKEAQKRAVNLAFSVGTTPATKMDADSFTEVNPNPVFRGMVDIKLIPFNKVGAIEPTDQANYFPQSLPNISSLSPDLSAHYYASGLDAWFPVGTASLLLYGRAPEGWMDSNPKHKYGSLVRGGFSGSGSPPSVSAITFSPDVMAPGEATPQEAQTIVRVLNNILLGNTYSVLVYYGDGKTRQINLNWNESVGESNLREAYRQITNEGAFIPGSGPLAESMLSSLYGMLSGYESHNTNVYEVVVDGVPYEAHTGSLDGPLLLYKDLYNGLRDHVLQRFNAFAVTDHATVDATTHTVTFKDDKVRNYPEGLGLPSGCAILRWTPTGFVVPQMNGVEGIAPMNRYCYPPALYYYANTTIKTSKDENIQEAYSERGYTQWSQVLADYTLGTAISSNTKSVALVTPAQFAVGMLSATVKSSRSWLQDGDGLPETTVEAVGENLPITGIILGGQFKQRFDFTPVYPADDAVEYYLFDNQTPGVFLTAANSDPIRTLSLQTPDDMDIYFTLEFRNDTGKTFYGADGRILPGRKFYMVGKLELPSSPRAFDSVFVKDHITTVTCTIHSLDGAYNAIPDLGLPQLVLGVQTQVNWTLATPTTVIME